MLVENNAMKRSRRVRPNLHHNQPRRLAYRRRYPAKNMSKCFIIMPITTPEATVPRYGGDADHFEHVLDHLFVPAVERAGYEPIPPIAEGSDLIHARIITNLDEADLVLCDMSCLNPNVFLSLGFAPLSTNLFA